MYYGIHKGRKIGVFRSWQVVKPLVNGFSGAVYKSFALPSQAEYFSIHGCAEPPKAKLVIKSKPQKPASAAPASVDLKKIVRPSTSNSKKPSAGFIEKLKTDYYRDFPQTDKLFVYTDGSTIHNGKVNARGGHGVFFSEPKFDHLSKQRSGKVTNNIVELSAIIDAMKYLKTQDLTPYKSIMIVTDSDYSHKAITERYAKWQKNGWVVSYNGKSSPVKNKELIIEAHKLVNQVGCQMRHVYAQHDTNKTDIYSAGNQIADNLAKFSY